MRIFVVIPSLNPSENLIRLVHSLNGAGLTDIVVVNDGSSTRAAALFDSLRQLNCHVVDHCYNLGKGRAIKSAINYIANHFPEAEGIITCDADGQHRAEDIVKIKSAFEQHPGEIIIGCRTFSSKQTPLPNKAGNLLTRAIVYLVCGRRFKDTQTGLRGYPKSVFEKLMNLEGERYELETEMLLKIHSLAQYHEIPIQTVYDTGESSHFNKLTDSLVIYRRIFFYMLPAALASIAGLVIYITLSMLFGKLVFSTQYVPFILFAVIPYVFSLFYKSSKELVIAAMFINILATMAIAFLFFNVFGIQSGTARYIFAFNTIPFYYTRLWYKRHFDSKTCRR